MNADPPAPAAHSIVLYDGVCGLCHRFNRFVLKRDRRDRFRFAPLQGTFASQALGRHGKDPRDLDTVYLIVDAGGPREEALSRGHAVRRILSELGGVWRFAAAVLRLLPGPLLDAAYDFTARRRYRWFGKYESCPAPSEKDRRKFLDI